MRKYTLYRKFENEEDEDKEINEGINAILILKNEWVASDEFIINFLQTDYNELFIKHVLETPKYNNRYNEVKRNHLLINVI